MSDIDKLRNPEIKKAFLGKIHLTATRTLEEEFFDNLKLREALEVATSETRKAVLSLTTYIWGLEDETIEIHHSWPKTWWDAFKSRWFPAWLLRAFPPEYERIDISEKRYYTVCPHLPTDEAELHMLFMIHGREARIRESSEASSQEEA